VGSEPRDAEGEPRLRPVLLEHRSARSGPSSLGRRSATDDSQTPEQRGSPFPETIANAAILE
jgi:hypothetical protein